MSNQYYHFYRIHDYKEAPYSRDLIILISMYNVLHRGNMVIISKSKNILKLILNDIIVKIVKLIITYC